MNNTLLDKLTQLKIEENCLKRNIDTSYCDKNARTRFFNRLKEIKKEKEIISFKLRLERKIENEKLR